MKKLILVSVIAAITMTSAKAYYHCYSDKCDAVRLGDKIERLEKTLIKTDDEAKQKRITIELEEAKAELEKVESKLAKK